jgi:hypothetical protein
MKKTFQLEIKNPCSADLNTMNKTTNGFFCNLCSKEVVDFTNKNDVELRKVFLSETKNNVCGKFNNHQIVSKNSIQHKFSIPLKYVFLVSLVYGKNVFSQTLKNNDSSETISTESQNKPMTRIVLGMPSRPERNLKNLNVFTIKSELILIGNPKRKAIKGISLYFLGSKNDARYEESTHEYVSDVELEKDFVNFYTVITYKNKKITKIFRFDATKIINNIYQQNVYLTIEDVNKLGIK